MPFYSLFFGSLFRQPSTQHQVFPKCYGVWNKAKEVYTNYVNRFYNIVTIMFFIKLENMNISMYLGRLHSLIVDHKNLMLKHTANVTNSSWYMFLWIFL